MPVYFDILVVLAHGAAEAGLLAFLQLPLLLALTIPLTSALPLLPITWSLPFR